MLEVAIYAALLLLCCVLALLLVLQRQSKANARAQAWRLGHEQGQAQAKALYAQQVARMSAYEQLLRGQSGGVGKQLADTREVAELIHRQAPALLRESNGLAQLLHGHDEFLGQLLDAYLAADQDGGAQARAAARQPAGIYADVFEAAGLPAPGAVVGKFFVLALEAGILVIRTTGKQGCFGRLRLARRDLERFFNDLATKPRSLADERESGVACRGLYRVDLSDDTRHGQLVIEAAAPSSGHLYFGHPELEQEPLRELKSLKRAALKLLEDEARSPGRKAAAQRARILRRDALLGHVPDDGLCAACEGDVTMRLRLGDKPMGCPLCGTPWSD